MNFMSQLGALGNDMLGGRYFPDERINRAKAIANEGERQLKEHLEYTRDLRTKAIALGVLATGAALIARSDYTPIIALATGFVAVLSHFSVSATEAQITRLRNIRIQHNF